MTLFTYGSHKRDEKKNRETFRCCIMHGVVMRADSECKFNDDTAKREKEKGLHISKI